MNTHNQNERVHILLVDDEEDILTTMETFLKKDHYTISTAKNGLDALKVIEDSQHQERGIDLLITDIAMPELSGSSLIETIQKRNLNIQSLVISAYGSKSKIIELVHKGIVGYIDKPFSMKELREQVAEIIQKIKAIKREKYFAQKVMDEKENRITVLEGQLIHSQTFETIGKLASGIVHDFNNLLVAIGGFSDLMQGVLQTMDGHNDKVKKCLSFTNNIQKASIKAHNSIKILQAFAKQDNQKLKMLDIHPLIEDVIRITSGSIKNNTSIVPRFQALNPFILGEATLLSNAFLNLILNAKDAMPEGGTIFITTEIVRKNNPLLPTQPPPNSLLQIKIRDTGIGMSDKIQKKIFEPFYTTKGEKGNGLGLTSVLSTVTKHRGHISCASNQGKGTEFTIEIPSVQP